MFRNTRPTEAETTQRDSPPVNDALPTGFDEPGHPMFTPVELRPFYSRNDELERGHWEVNGLPRVARRKLIARFEADPAAFAAHIRQRRSDEQTQRRALMAGPNEYRLTLEETKEASAEVTGDDRERYLHARRIAAAVPKAREHARARSIRAFIARNATCEACGQVDETDVLPTAFDSARRAQTFRDLGHHPTPPTHRLCGPCRRVSEDQLGHGLATQSPLGGTRLQNRQQLVATWLEHLPT